MENNKKQAEAASDIVEKIIAFATEECGKAGLTEISIDCTLYKAAGEKLCGIQLARCTHKI